MKTTTKRRRDGEVAETESLARRIHIERRNVKRALPHVEAAGVTHAVQGSQRPRGTDG
jgi:hypothetical protein